MRPVLKDPVSEKKFQEKGYIHLPFLSKEEVKFLWNQFDEALKSSGGPCSPRDAGIDSDYEISYDFTFLDKNADHKREVIQLIDKVFKPHYEKILDNYRPIIANYIRKKEQTGEVPMHQNWAFADERKCGTVSIWVPLVDSHRGNGALEVVPASHKRFGELRGPMIPWELEKIKQKIIDNDLVTCDIKAGEAIILDDSIVHYSHPNTTKDLRIAIQLILIPNEMPSIHYHMNQQVSTQTVNVLEVEQDFYMGFNPWKQPTGAKKISERKFVARDLTYAEFKERVGGPRFDENPTFLQKVKAVFS
ncbi:MAG: phytanoyl-CoA dioxygenase family protein [Flavobacteriales bacterium]|nr:phytanoyl-CoA dioxygenase family protein [Flavobacteriales bacterium]